MDNLMRGIIFITFLPTTVWAAAFQWDFPQATMANSAVLNKTPTVTKAPENLPAHIFRPRQMGNMANTCGFVSGVRELPLTCTNPTDICITNTLHGVGGCADPKSSLYYSIPTTCIPSASLSLSCDASCSSDGYITKCSNSVYSACYKFIVQYSATSMTHHGCGTIVFTLTAARWYSNAIEIITPGLTRTVSVVASTLPPAPAQTVYKVRDNNVGAIAGGTVGGLAVLSATCFGIYFLWQKSKQAKDARNTDNTPTNATMAHELHGVYGQAWQYTKGPYNPPVEVEAKHGESEAASDAEIYELPGHHIR